MIRRRCGTLRIKTKCGGQQPLTAPGGLEDRGEEMDKLAPLPIIPGMRRIRSLPLVPSAPEQRIHLQDNSFMLRSVSLILNLCLYWHIFLFKFFVLPILTRPMEAFLKSIRSHYWNYNSFFMKKNLLFRTLLKNIIKKQGNLFLNFDSIAGEHAQFSVFY